MRKLRRHLQRWERYAAATGHSSPRDRWSDSRRWLSGHCRAFDAFEAEADRRDPWRGYGPCYCMGCIGSGRCDDDLDDEDWGEEYEDDGCGPDCGCHAGEGPIVSVPDISTWRMP